MLFTCKHGVLFTCKHVQWHEFMHIEDRLHVSAYLVLACCARLRSMPEIMFALLFQPQTANYISEVVLKARKHTLTSLGTTT